MCKLFVNKRWQNSVILSVTGVICLHFYPELRAEGKCPKI